MVTAANIEIVARNEFGGGLVSVVVKGDVGAVKAAPEAGAQAASAVKSGEIGIDAVHAKLGEDGRQCRKHCCNQAILPQF
ncbi:MAG: BMC domain-containing protein [Cyanobacteria bacterium P01_E01_bin.48]